MRQRHRNLRAAEQMDSARQRGGALTALIALLALGLSGGVAQAQFSGPALSSTAPVNLPVTPTTDPAILYPAGRDIHLTHGDLLTIHLYGTPDYAPPVRVSLDGSIQLPLIGTVHVEGLKLSEAELLIAQRLTDAGMYRNPQVTIVLTESPNQVVTLSGEMHGVLPVAGARRLFDVLSAAGGLPQTASHMITINRPGVTEPIVVDLGNDPAQSARADVPVFPGDTIIVARIGVVYLLGAFKTQGAVPIRENAPLTLMQVAAIGGGIGFEGKMEDLKIIRTVGLERKVVEVDIKKVIEGKTPDPVLQADDIVFLPTSQMKAAIKSGGLSTLIGLASILTVAAHQ